MGRRRIIASLVVLTVCSSVIFAKAVRNEENLLVHISKQCKRNSECISIYQNLHSKFKKCTSSTGSKIRCTKFLKTLKKSRLLEHLTSHEAKFQNRTTGNPFHTEVLPSSHVTIDGSERELVEPSVVGQTADGNGYRTRRDTKGNE